MLIGELSKRSGLSRDTIRYYEKLSLLSVEGRTHSGGYKRYAQNTLERLHQIQCLKQIGFTLVEIQTLLGAIKTQHPCAHLPENLELKLHALDQQIAALHAVRDQLREVAQRCNSKCEIKSGLPSCVPTAKSKSCC